MKDANHLTPKQADFVRQYLIHMDGAKAARAAGYGQGQPERQALALLRDPRIKQLVAEGIQARNERLLLSADWVVERLKLEATYHGEDSSHAARVAALNLLGKHLGLFQEQAHTPKVTFLFNGSPPPAAAVAVQPRLEAKP
jgi:hypothetical protein